MRIWLGVILVCLTVPSAIGQTPSSKYQPGTIMAVTPRQKPGQPDSDVTQYDVLSKSREYKVRGFVYPTQWRQHSEISSGRPTPGSGRQQDSYI